MPQENEIITSGRPRNANAHAAVLETTLTLLLEKGYVGVSIEGIAAQSGVSKQTIYRWWKSKGEIILEAFADWARQAIPLPDTGMLENDLRGFLTLTFKAMRGDVGRINRALVTEAMLNDSFAATLLAKVIEPRRALVRTLLDRAVKRGEIAPPEDIDTLIDLAFGPMWYRALITNMTLDDALASRLAKTIALSTNACQQTSSKRNH